MQGLSKDAIRAELPATAAVVYLNNGTYGPLPRCAAKAIENATDHDLQQGRISGGMQGFLDYFAELAALRSDLGRIINAPASEIALTRSTTEGINIGLWGRSWSSDDEVLTTTQEHPGVLFPLALLRRRYGVKVTFVDVGLGETDRTLDAFAKALHPGVRMVALSHVLYSTGATLPLREITELAHAVGAVVHVDGAQSVGAVPVDVKRLGVDTYAFPGQKWLCGPDASGGIYVAANQFEELQPLCVSFSTVDFRQFDPASPLEVTVNPDAARYETGTMYRPAVKGFAASVDWLLEDVGFSNALGSIEELSTYCRARFSEVPGMNVLTPEGQTSGLVAFQIGDGDVDGAVAHLVNEGIAIRSVHECNALRISTGFYNTSDEVDRALTSIVNYLG
jgi:L-cysteine/cystine lyase